MTTPRFRVPMLVLASLALVVLAAAPAWAGHKSKRWKNRHVVVSGPAYAVAAPAPAYYGAPMVAAAPTYTTETFYAAAPTYTTQTTYTAAAPVVYQPPATYVDTAVTPAWFAAPARTGPRGLLPRWRGLRGR